MLLSHLLVGTLLTIILCNGQSDHAGEGKSKKAHSGILHHKKKHHFHTPDVNLKYGIDLPSFSFDYSEFFAGAMIERSFDKNELHLTMFLLGHKSITSNFPFEAISTEEDIIHSWGQAVKVWNSAAYRNATKNTVGSGFFCTLHNNDHRNTPYQVPAYWVPLETHHRGNDSNLDGVYGILRCKIKGASAIYRNETFHSEKKLFVDILRKACNKHHPEACVLTAADNSSIASSISGSSGSGSSSPSAVMSSDPRQVIVSFSVPWRDRQIGYPLHFHNHNASRFDPWTEVATPNNHSLHVATTHICVGGMRPLHPTRADVGLPMLLEFIRHHLSLGVSHIFLGILIDWDSPHMHKHLHVLRSFIADGRVSLASLSAPRKTFTGAPYGTSGLDDLAGMEGVVLRDEFAEMLFLNECLYYSKGVADHVLVLKASDFVVPARSTQNINSVIKSLSTLGVGGSSGWRGGRRSLLDEEQQEHEPPKKLRDVLFPSRAERRRQRQSVATDRFANFDPSSYLRGQNSRTSQQAALRSVANTRGAAVGAVVAHSRRTNRTATTADVVCSYSLAQFGVVDPPDSFWGPADDAWTRDFFRASPAAALDLSSLATLPILLMSTRQVIGVDVSAGGRASAHCRPHHAANRTTLGSALHRGERALHNGSAGQHVTIPVEAMAAVIYREALGKTQLRSDGGPSAAAAAEQAAEYLHRLNGLHNATAHRLTYAGLGTIAKVKALIAESKRDFASGLIKPHEQKGRSSIKPPFWRSCKTKTLSEAITNVYS